MSEFMISTNDDRALRVAKPIFTTKMFNLNLNNLYVQSIQLFEIVLKETVLYVRGCVLSVFIFYFKIYATVPRDVKMLLKCQLEDEILSKV